MLKKWIVKMKPVASSDFAARDRDGSGTRSILSHAFASANTALEETRPNIAEHAAFNAKTVRVDIFATRDGGAVDTRADVWAFGVLVTRTLSGRKPFGGETPTEVMRQIVMSTPDLKFLHDESFDAAAHMDRLFNDPRVQADLRREDD